MRIKDFIIGKKISDEPGTCNIKSHELMDSFLEDGKCPLCGEETSCLSGNPGMWPIQLPVCDGTGKVYPHHMICVLNKVYPVSGIK